MAQGCRGSFLDIEVSTPRPEHAVLTLRGRLDLWTASHLDTTLAGLVDQGFRYLTLQLVEVGYLDSTGLNIMLAAHKRVSTMGGGLTVTCPCRRVRKVLEATGAHKVLRISQDKVVAA